MEQQAQQLEKQLLDANTQLTKLQEQHEQLRKECEKRVAAVKQSAAAERGALAAKHAGNVKKLQEAAKDKVGFYSWHVSGGLHETTHLPQL